MTPQTLEGEDLQKFLDFDRKVWRRMAIETAIMVTLAIFLDLLVSALPLGVQMGGTFFLVFLLIFRAGMLDWKVQKFHRSLEKPAP